MRWPWQQPAISGEVAESLREQPRCTHCGGWHARACPRVKRMRFRGGELVEIEFWPAWRDDLVIYPDQIEEDQRPTPPQ